VKKNNTSGALTLKPRKEKIVRGKTEKICLTIAFIIFVIYTISILFPFLWALLNTFKDRREFIFNIWGLPKEFTLKNWKSCLSLSYEGVDVLGMIGNSLFFAFACTFISTYFSSCTAYAITKYKFPGRNFLYIFAFMMMFIPAVGSMAANYKLYNDLHLYDTYLGILIGSCSGFGTGFIFLYSFFRNLPWSYAEAAQLDGAGHHTVFLKIMMPMALPSLTAIMIMNILGIWNEYFTFYMYAPTKVTLAVGLYEIVQQNSYGKVGYPELFAVMLFSVVPAIVLYTLAQKTVVENFSIGGLKG
jgi:ABC-type glycerol-3-phosphate transport system permease component